MSGTLNFTSRAQELDRFSERACKLVARSTSYSTKTAVRMGQLSPSVTFQWVRVPARCGCAFSLSYNTDTVIKKKLPFACKQTGNILLYVKVFFASCKSQIPKPNSPNTARKFLKQPPKSGYFYRKK